MNITILRRENDLSGDAELLARAISSRGGVLTKTTSSYDGYSQPDHLIRWGCTNQFPSVLGTTLNNAKAIQSVSNKGLWRASMQMQGLGHLIPLTWFHPYLCPFHYNNQGYIVRPTKHARGREFHVVSSAADVIPLQQRLGSVYIQERLHVEAEYRILFVHRKIVQVVQRDVHTTGQPVPQNENNVNNMKWGQWPLQILSHVQPVIDSCDLAFGAVDVMVGCPVVYPQSEGGTYLPYVSEINSAPEIYPYSASCLAKALIHDLTLDDDRTDRVDLTQATSYHHFIHPALLAS